MMFGLAFISGFYLTFQKSRICFYMELRSVSQEYHKIDTTIVYSILTHKVMNTIFDAFSSSSIEHHSVALIKLYAET